MMLHRVEFCGLPSPWSDPEIQYRKITGRLTKAQRARIWEAETEQQRLGYRRFYGATCRILGNEVELFPDGAYRQIVPEREPPRKQADGSVRGGYAPGWTWANRIYGRLDDLPQEKVLRFKGATYVAEKGWDRVYQFGPYDFTQLMTEGDLARLMANEVNRRLFRDLEHPLILNVMPKPDPRLVLVGRQNIVSQLAS